MSVGLETDPFLDKQVIEFAWNLPLKKGKSR